MSGGQAAQVFIVVDPIPANTDFKLGSPSTVLGTTGMTVTVEFSDDIAATWTYTPVSGGGGALAGYDRMVTHVRWRLHWQPAVRLRPTMPAALPSRPAFGNGNAARRQLGLSLKYLILTPKVPM